MSYAVVSLHTPYPEHRAALLDSMHPYSATARRQPGLVHTGVVEDDGGQLVGLAI